ncbi:MAG: DUF3795 domain-containing protein [Promethearchaeota archaeon]|nr:MAG: DUF3795 domain-containing protein [Candidatus Lokiarchaeota archaeon]
MDDKAPELLTYCGLYCGICPSFHRGTCYGCRSEDKTQNRTSKWGCKIRNCCINEKEILYCGECSDFPCNKITSKLINSHPNDFRFTYRHEIPNNIIRIKSLGFTKWIEREKEKWKCNKCGNFIVFYDYKCIECNNKYNPNDLKVEEN